MRVGVLRLVLVVVVLVPLARCGGVIAGGSDGGADGSSGVPCSASGACPTGLACFYPISEGCGAVGQCMPFSTGCKPGPGCGCDGKTALVVCGSPGYAKEPIQYAGPCADGGTIGPDGCHSGLACELCDVSGYTPTPVSRPMAILNACTTSEMNDLATACFGTNATQQTCNAWQTAQGDAGSCLPCVFTLQSAAVWGPIVCDSTSCSVNTAGCVDMLLGQVAAEKASGGPGSCGDLIDASYGCQDYACSTCSSNGAPNSDFNACLASAVSNECKAYADAVNSTTGPCATLEGDGGAAAAVCFPQAANGIPVFLNLFCGTGP